MLGAWLLFLACLFSAVVGGRVACDYLARKIAAEVRAVMFGGGSNFRDKGGV